MLNQVILVGRVNKFDKIAGIVSIDIKRPNEKVSDVISVNLTDGLMESVLDYLTEGSTIGVKASLNIDNNILRIIADKITFIEKNTNE
jgi:single-stranded DNA-binding protein